MRTLITIALAILTAPYSMADTTSSGLYNTTTHAYSVEENIHEIRPIASITKLFTAYTIIKSNVPLDEVIPLKGKASSRWNRRAKNITRIQLLHTMLMSSDNLAAESLANAHPGGYEQFLIDANQLVAALNLNNTTIADATGLLATNTSTIDDITSFLINTIDKEPIIKSLSTTKKLKQTYPVQQKNSKSSTTTFNNTNHWIRRFDNIILTKTGYTTAAGRCLAMLIYNNNTLYALVTLGNASPTDRDRIVLAMIKHM